MIRILHLSDFHCKINHSEDFIEMGQKIALNVKENLGNDQIDFIVFSGDLVFTGDKKDSFLKAAEYLFNPIKEAYNLTNDQILIAPGNHDREFAKELPMVKQSIDACKTSKELEFFCENEQQMECSVVNQKEYLDFINEFYGTAWEKKPLYCCRKIQCNGHIVGLLALNSSWRCNGDSKKDRGNLLFPSFILREALNKIKDSEFVFCTEHHNIYDYKEFVATEIEDLLHEKCHVFFTGHYHKASVNVNHDAEVGMIQISAPATFNRDDFGINFGYCLIEFDETDQKAMVCPYIYSDLQFIKGTEKAVNVPMSKEKIRQNEFRKLIRKRYNETLAIADDLFVSHGPGMFLQMFKDPIIKNKSVQEIITSRREGIKTSLDDIAHQKKSAIVFGYGKRGKTSLLRKIEIDTLKKVVSEKVIPYYMSYIQYKGKDFKLVELLRNYLEQNNKDTQARFEKYSLLLLIDDLNPTDSAFMGKLMQEMTNFERCRFIATAQESMSNQIPLINFYGTDIDKYYIHDVTTREVRQLTNSWPMLTQDQKREVEEKLIQIFDQMHIPLNYWSISLFLWIYAKTDNTNIHNNFDLIRLYVDELLDAKNYINNPDFSVTYDDLKSYMGALAVEIMKNGYALTDAQLTLFTEEYKQKHNKFTNNPLDIINYLINKAVLTRDAAGKVTIRLKGVFEYFIAYHMSENPTFREDVLKCKNSFMPFGNEWELYAGFCKDDEHSFRELFNSIRTVMKEWTSMPDFKDIDSRIHQRVILTDEIKEATGMLISRLDQMPEDEGYDILPPEGINQGDTFVQPKQIIDNVEITASNIERMIFVLARLYRNSNICDIKGMSDEMFNYILDGACNLGFLLINEAKLYATKDDENFLQLVMNSMPIIVEAFFYDAIAQKNLTRVFENKLNTYMKKPQGNQMRIYMMAMVLMDIDAVHYQKVIFKVLDIINNNVLRFSILQKTLLNSMRVNESDEVKNALKPIRKKISGEFYKSYEEQEDLEKRIRDVETRNAAMR